VVDFLSPSLYIAVHLCWGVWHPKWCTLLRWGGNHALAASVTELERIAAYLDQYTRQLEAKLQRAL